MKDKLPEKWCIRCTRDNAEIIDSWKQTTKWTDDAYLYPYISFDGSGIASPLVGYIEITFEEFKRLILNMKEEKEIIGYNIKSEFITSVDKIAKLLTTNVADESKYFWMSLRSERVNNAKRYKVLDLWFEPVYKEVAPELPVINSHSGKLDGDYVIYGMNCAQFHKNFFKGLNNTLIAFPTQNRAIVSIKLDSGVEITMKDIEQIVKYLDYHKL